MKPSDCEELLKLINRLLLIDDIEEWTDLQTVIDYCYEQSQTKDS